MIRLQNVAAQLGLCPSDECVKWAHEELLLGNLLLGNLPTAKVLAVADGGAGLEFLNSNYALVLCDGDDVVEIDGLRVPAGQVFFVGANSTVLVSSGQNRMHVLVAGGLELERSGRELGAGSALFMPKGGEAQRKIGSYFAEGVLRRGLAELPLLHLIRAENGGDLALDGGLDSCDAMAGTVTVDGRVCDLAEIDWPLLRYLRGGMRVKLQWISVVKDRELVAQRRRFLRQARARVDLNRVRGQVTVDGREHRVYYTPLLAGQASGQSLVELRDSDSPKLIHIERQR